MTYVVDDTALLVVASSPLLRPTDVTILTTSIGRRYHLQQHPSPRILPATARAYPRPRPIAVVARRDPTHPCPAPRHESRWQRCRWVTLPHAAPARPVASTAACQRSRATTGPPRA
ncbi:hypothetical protein E2562_016720 [Oryza meyeriana var. granulata]|uniref:Uncharacterized protein n=1 Tax=Oryza meyeriana var. granulata TaxID=110450 RepID=A0A6G1BS70_9ORYZ|nr:hypothetical protein E2562_006551 [Oryza meyeriana var. granulata]KAF0892433.1 hypothetical protein E2562_016720 [Oryza meyeriana var. granulata]